MWIYKMFSHLNFRELFLSDCFWDLQHWWHHQSPLSSTFLKRLPLEHSSCWQSCVNSFWVRIWCGRYKYYLQLQAPVHKSFYYIVFSIILKVNYLYFLKIILEGFFMVRFTTYKCETTRARIVKWICHFYLTDSVMCCL